MEESSEEEREGVSVMCGEWEGVLSVMWGGEGVGKCDVWRGGGCAQCDVGRGGSR